MIAGSGESCTVSHAASITLCTASCVVWFRGSSSLALIARYATSRRTPGVAKGERISFSILPSNPSHSFKPQIE